MRVVSGSINFLPKRGSSGVRAPNCGTLENQKGGVGEVHTTGTHTHIQKDRCVSCVVVVVVFGDFVIHGRRITQRLCTQTNIVNIELQDLMIKQQKKRTTEKKKKKTRTLLYTTCKSTQSAVAPNDGPAPVR